MVRFHHLDALHRDKRKTALSFIPLPITGMFRQAKCLWSINKPMKEETDTSFVRTQSIIDCGMSAPLSIPASPAHHLNPPPSTYTPPHYKSFEP